MFDYAQVAAVEAVIRTGSFEKAARHLAITPSAVSQRVRQLEEQLGIILIVRGQPCVATPAGERLFRHAEEVALMERGLSRELGLGEGPMPMLRIAVNADSLATWFIEAMAGAGECLFDLVLDDQDHSADWLRRGEVRAAVSAFSGAVQGCDVKPLGALRYIATASPAFVSRWFAEGVGRQALAQAPCITFNAKDALQTRWIEATTGQRIDPPTHWLPSSQAFVDGCLAGLGWGMNPLNLVSDLIATGRLVPLVDNAFLDVPLFWHWSRSVGKAMMPVTQSVQQAARGALLPPGYGSGTSLTEMR
ncbi:LysR family transcriptional regulator ArgP [Rhizobium sp. RU36D]|uniref:LysR family transcriptional regulator ArgP n=1 Tax=Rhizobium sp. RU36D TaxID=1907415 RepID=UPI0009D8D87D|nr:LysR family transcriptional regulator ArgP [Rhizobium sp. RU36D]SMC60543.1 LysR family transcriptional regulator, chromosome initiation inhibitor [Rhizobium sp. RU36D]